jgi:hypothetical protein
MTDRERVLQGRAYPDRKQPVTQAEIMLDLDAAGVDVGAVREMVKAGLNAETAEKAASHGVTMKDIYDLFQQFGRSYIPIFVTIMSLLKCGDKKDEKAKGTPWDNPNDPNRPKTEKADCEDPTDPTKVDTPKPPPAKVNIHKK